MWDCNLEMWDCSLDLLDCISDLSENMKDWSGNVQGFLVRSASMTDLSDCSLAMSGYSLEMLGCS